MSKQCLHFVRVIGAQVNKTLVKAQTALEKYNADENSMNDKD